MLSRRTALFVASSFAFTAAAAGCSSNGDVGSGGGGSTSTTGTGPSTSAGSSGSGGSGGVFDPGGEVTTIESGIGPFNAVPPGTEDVKCITTNLKNAEGSFARRFRATLNSGSHHMIIYRSSATEEALTPVPCNSFSGIIKGEHPLFIAQQANSELIFPKDENGVPVGFELEPNQMVKIEMHFINTSDQPMDIQGAIQIDTVPLSTNIVRSDLAFWGTQDIHIPPNSAWDHGMKFQRALANTKSFALTTHQHQLGTRMRIWHATNKNDTGAEPVADGQNWHDPPLEIFDPPLEFPDDGKGLNSSKGFAYKCEWNNTTPNEVTFGEGFNQEMCFLWHYYFPSQGFQICFDGLCKTSGI